ncbi:hypothetical protein COOONC_09984 [Cooperia oncophora]
MSSHSPGNSAHIGSVLVGCTEKSLPSFAGARMFSDRVAHVGNVTSHSAILEMNSTEPDRNECLFRHVQMLFIKSLSVGKQVDGYEDVEFNHQCSCCL